MASTEWALLIASLSAFIVNIVIVVIIFCGKTKITSNNENLSVSRSSKNYDLIIF